MHNDKGWLAAIRQAKLSVIRVMRWHKRNHDVQKEGMGILVKLSEDAKEEKEKEEEKEKKDKEEEDEKEGQTNNWAQEIEKALALLKNEDLKLEIRAFELLTNIAKDEEGRREIKAAGGVKAVLSTLTAGPTFEVLSSCILLLAAPSTDEKYHRRGGRQVQQLMDAAAGAML